MPTVNVELLEESRSRYLVYALSVVNSRALPDVRDGLKPVQRRILYAMYRNLSLLPEKPHRKSAAVVGEVLARFHPHGDAACYEAMVRMAQDFSLRYPLVDGQGNFGSLDGDSAAAYRYTEAKLTELAIEVLGDIGQETVVERDNFDQTIKEPIVLPTRIPNLLMNGCSGIAVGMATAIPPHNISEVIRAILLLLDDDEVADAEIFKTIKGPDFPTGCLIFNTREELRKIYSTGRGAIKMRAGYEVEKAQRGKELLVINSMPYGLDKSLVVERIADHIIQKKLPQVLDIRDESTDKVRVVLELAADVDSEKVMTYLYKNTDLETLFHVNLTAIVPTKNPLSGKPMQLTLRQMLNYFIDFRLDVTRFKLEFERKKLEERIHLLEGLLSILKKITEVIEIVRASKGRSDGASRLVKEFKLTEVQAFFIVDLHVYQLSRTSIEEVEEEYKDKKKRKEQIDEILKSEKLLKKEIKKDLERILEKYGDNRRSKIVTSFEEQEYNEQDFIQHEDVFVIVSKDAWIKRIRQNNDPSGTRLREGDSILFLDKASTKDSLVVFTNKGNAFVLKIMDVSATSGFGEPAQKMFRFEDGERVVSCLILHDGQWEKEKENQIVIATKFGFGFKTKLEEITSSRKGGKRIIKLGNKDMFQGEDEVVSVVIVKNTKDLLFLITSGGVGLCFLLDEVSLLGASSKGVILQRVSSEDTLQAACVVAKQDKLTVEVENGKAKEVEVKSLEISKRGNKGDRLFKKGTIVKSVVKLMVDSK